MFMWYISGMYVNILHDSCLILVITHVLNLCGIILSAAQIFRFEFMFKISLPSFRTRQKPHLLRLDRFRVSEFVIAFPLSYLISIWHYQPVEAIGKAFVFKIIIRVYGWLWSLDHEMKSTRMIIGVWVTSFSGSDILRLWTNLLVRIGLFNGSIVFFVWIFKCSQYSVFWILQIL